MLWKDKEMHNNDMASVHYKHYVLLLLYSEKILGSGGDNICLMSSLSDSFIIFFVWDYKKQGLFGLSWCVRLLKSFHASAFKYVLEGRGEKCSSSELVRQISNAIMYYLPCKKLRHCNFPSDGPESFRRSIVNHGLDLTNRLTERSDLIFGAAEPS